MERKLASVQKILDVRPIDGADMIEVVDVLGWSVVVSKKDAFKPGDLCVYFEIDAFLDATDTRYATFEERFINWNSKRGMRLKTIKLRKQVSQGLVLKLDQFTEIKNPQEGDDVTDLLKIEKWESAVESSGNGMGGKTAGAKPFPAFLRKSDQERIQNYIGEIPKHSESFEISIKLDGSSMTVFYVPKFSNQFDFAWQDIETRLLRGMSKLGKLWYKVKKTIGLVKPPASISGVCSRNIQLDIDHSNHFSKFVRDNNILERLENYGQAIAIQGELIGPSIQENYEKVDKLEFYVYDVFNIDTQDYLLPGTARAVVEFLGLNYVPVLHEEAKLSDFGDITKPRELSDKILTFAEGPGMNQGVKREGIVLKSNLSSFSTKAISNSYLLKKKD